MLYDPKWNLDQASLLLLTAADILEKEGWCQYVLLNMEGEKCVLGAIYHSAGAKFGGWGLYEGAVDPHTLVEAVRRLAEYVNPREGTKHFHVSEWNDKRGRKPEEILHALRHVAWGGKNDRG